MTVVGAPVEKVHNQAFNTGSDELNHQILELAEVAARAVPGCAVEIKAQAGADERTYKADFGKFARTFPDFKFQWTAEKGAQELSQAFQSIGLTRKDFTDKRFTRLKWLRYLLDTGQLDGQLCWKQPAEEKAAASAGEGL